MRRSLPLAAVLAAAALVTLLAYGLASRGGSSTLDEAVASGQRPPAPAAARELPRLGGGGTVALSDFRGRPVLLNFWASWCDPCREEADLLERAHRRLRRAGGTALGVTVKDAERDSLRFVREFDLTWPSVRDVDGDLGRAFGSTGVPETFLLDPEGRVVAVRRGQVTAAWLDRHLPALLPS